MECITHCHCISHLITSLPPHQTPLFQTTYSTSHHHSSFYHSAPRSTLTLQYRISNRTVSATLCITPLTFHITDVPRNATFHVLHAASVSDHTIYWPHHLCIAPQTALHNIAPHSTCSTSCIIPPQLTDHTIPHRTSEHHHILHPST